MGRKNTALKIAEPQTLTDQQEAFIHFLLDGYSISQAAQAVGTGRIKATYWMAMGHLVRVEYEQRRMELRDQRLSRIETIQEKVLTAIENALDDDERPELRVKVALFLYKEHFSQSVPAYGQLRDARSLVVAEGKERGEIKDARGSTYGPLSHIEQDITHLDEL